MADIVLFQGQQTSAAEGMVFAGALPCFFSVTDAKSAKALCRKKSALIRPANYEVDEGDLLELARAGGAIVFSFSDVLSESGFRRSILVSKMRLLISACRKRGTGFIFATLAKDAAQVRSSRELAAFAAVLGATDVERKAAEKRMAIIALAGAKAKSGAPSALAAKVEK